MKFLLGSNVIIAAIKHTKATTALKLTIEFSEQNVQLVGNKYLAYEYGKMVERFPSETAREVYNKEAD